MPCFETGERQPRNDLGQRHPRLSTTKALPTQFLIQDTGLWWQILAPKNCKTTCPKVENEISNVVHVQCILHLLKARTTMDNIIIVTLLYTRIPAKIYF